MTTLKQAGFIAERTVTPVSSFSIAIGTMPDSSARGFTYVVVAKTPQGEGWRAYENRDEAYHVFNAIVGPFQPAGAD